MKHHISLAALIFLFLCLLPNLVISEPEQKEDPYPHKIFTVRKKDDSGKVQSGDTVVGKLSVEKIDIQTKYGKLSVPLKEIKTIIPGLANHPEYLKSINSYVGQLSNNNFKKREEAQKSLIAEGSKITMILEKHLAKANEEEFDAELKTRLETIIQEFESASEEESGSDADLELIKEDQIFTTSFVIKGHILTQTFKFSTKYNEMTFSIKDIKKMQLKKPNKSKVLMQTFIVKGENFHNKNILNTSIFIKKGDIIELSAGGEIVLNPWGSNVKSDPEGHKSAGVMAGAKYFHGALLMQIGDGRFTKVGKKLRIEAQETGKLKLGIAMHLQYTRGNYKFPGEYKTKLTVLQKARR